MNRAMCRECRTPVPLTALAKGPDLNGEGVCVDCWPTQTDGEKS